jgi:hypothetical protein
LPPTSPLPCLADELFDELVEKSEGLILCKHAGQGGACLLTLSVTRLEEQSYAPRTYRARGADLLSLLRDAWRYDRKRHCSRCDRTKLVAEFSGGTDRYCRKCRAKRRLELKARRRREKLAAAGGVRG